MQRLTPFLLAAGLLCLPARSPAEEPVAATVETTLGTGAGQVRQFAFDGDDDTYFASAENAGSTDHFTLVFDRAVALKSVEAVTGRPDADGDRMDAGALEVSADGKTFEPVAKFEDGVARARTDGRQVRAVRLRPAAAMSHPLAVREIKIDSDPAVAVFKYPVEFVVDVADAPELIEWADKVARVCEREYPKICAELGGDDFKPRHLVTLTLKSSYRGVAATGGGRITGSVRYFKAHPDDVGAMVHETVHVVQRYGYGRDNPPWLVEGIADYVRFFKYEPGKVGPIDPDKAHYNGSYRVTARFLDYVTEKYDKEAVRKLNNALRTGKYKDELFKDLTGKTLSDLDEEWRASLRQ